MRNLLVLLLLLSCAFSIYAQEDRFSNVNQTKGKEIYVADNFPILTFRDSSKTCS